MKHKTLLRNFVTTALALLVGGCSHFQEPMFNRPDGVGSEPVLVIPFREPRRQLWYGESERGQTVADAFTAWVMMHATPNFPEGRMVDQTLRIVRDWNKNEIELDDWVRVADQTGARYLVVGQIEELTLQSPNTIGILNARIVSSYRVIDLEARTTVWQRKQHPVSLGRGRETDMPVISVEVDSLQVERTLLARLAEQIGRDLYGYEEEFGYN